MARSLDELDQPPAAQLDDEGPELTLALPDWLSAAIERRWLVWTRTDSLAMLAFVLHLGLLAVVIGRGSLFLDDLRVQAEAHQASLAGYVTDPATGPFAPLPGLLDWVLAHRYPLSHGPAALLTLIVRAGLAIGFWRLLRRLVGPGPTALLPFVALLVTPALLPATTWYRPSVTVLAAVACSIWAVDAFVAWQLQGGRWSLATLFVATVLACCCNLIGVAVPVVLLIVQLLVLAARPRDEVEGRPGRPGHPGRPGLRSALPGLGVALLAVAIFLPAYLTRSGAVVGAGGRADLPSLGWDALIRNVLPSLLGGPFGWSYERIYAGTPDPNPTVMVFAAVLVVVALGLAVRQSPVGTVRALILFATIFAVLTVVVGFGRPDAVGPLFTRADSLAVALVPFLLLAGALAVTPGRSHRADRRPDSPSGAPAAESVPAAGTAVPSVAELALRERARLAGVPMDQPLTRRQLREQQRAEPVEPVAPDQPERPSSPGPAPDPAGAIEIGVPAIAAGLVAVAILVGSLASTVTYTRKWWDNPTGIWLSRMQANLDGAEAYPRILATPLPSIMFPQSESRVFPSSAPLLLMIRPDVRFHDGDGQSRTMTGTGELVPPLVTTLGESRKSELCVATIREGDRVSRWIRLTKDAAYSPGAQVGIGVLTKDSGRVEVKVRTPKGNVLTPATFGDDELPAGAHTLHFPVPYDETVRWIQVSADAGSTTCVASAQVWAPYA